MAKKRLAHAKWLNENCLHIETQLGIVNVYVGLHDLKGRRIESVEIIPDTKEKGAPVGATVEGKKYHRVRIIENTLDGQVVTSKDIAITPERCV